MVAKKKSVKVVKTKKRSLIPPPDDIFEPSEDFLDYWSVIHGTSGIGKSSFILSIPDALLLQFEPARRNLRGRRPIEFRPRTVEELDKGAECPWTLFISVLAELETDNSVKVVGIDNIQELYRCCENAKLLELGLEAVPMKDFGATRGLINKLFENTLNNLKYDSRLGAIFTCHTVEREGELNTGTTDTIYRPAVTSAVFDYLKKAMDFAFYFGYHDKKRALHCRWDSIWTKCGVDGRFCNAKGTPLNAFAIPEDPKMGYPTLLKAWNNKLKGIIVSQDADE